MAVSPIGKGLTFERIDQGVDYGGSGPLYALGSGTIVNLFNSGWPSGNFLVLKLDQPVNGQSYVYYAEDITQLVTMNQKVTAGQHIADASGGPSGIEIGWASPPPLGTALAHTQFTGNNATAWGTNFYNLIKSLTSAGQGSAGSTAPAAAAAPAAPTAADLSPAGVLKGAEGLLHGAATVIDYFFGMFGRGQGWRFGFMVVMAAAVFASYRNLGSGGWA